MANHLGVRRCRTSGWYQAIESRFRQFQKLSQSSSAPGWDEGVIRGAVGAARLGAAGFDTALDLALARCETAAATATGRVFWGSGAGCGAIRPASNGV